jgi:hypothetical protein
VIPYALQENDRLTVCEGDRHRETTRLEAEYLKMNMKDVISGSNIGFSIKPTYLSTQGQTDFFGRPKRPNSQILEFATDPTNLNSCIS